MKTPVRKWLTSLLWGVALSGAAAACAAPEDTMSYLDNGQIRLGVDLSIGGAVTYLAEYPNPINMINSFDWGRQVQLSFYSGPVPFKPPGATLSPAWTGLGWNPIQAGDSYHHGSRVVEHRNDRKTIYVRCIPMIWPLDNVPAESTFECTYRLVGKTVEATSRLNNARTDQTQYGGRPQELPAVYTNGPWYKLVTYLGDHPFTGAPTTTVVDKNDGKGWPWVSFFGPEHWAALVDSNNHSIGVFNPAAYHFGAGFAGAPKGSGGPKDSQTGYIAPNVDEILDHNITYEFHYYLVVGTIQDIRNYAYAHAPKPKPPEWKFRNDRQHWTYTNTTDEGWPIHNELKVNPGSRGAAMVSPLAFWRAEDAPKLRMEAAFDTPAPNVEVLIEPFTDQDAHDSPAWGPGSTLPPKTMIGPVRIPIVGDGKYRTYTADLAGVAGYRGAMVRLRITVPDGKNPAKFRQIGIGK